MNSPVFCASFSTPSTYLASQYLGVSTGLLSVSKFTPGSTEGCTECFQAVDAARTGAYSVPVFEKSLYGE